jgi:hypothetical protein
MLKKWLMISAVLLLAAGLIMTGCNDDDDKGKNNGNDSNAIDFSLSTLGGVLNKENTGSILFTFTAPVARHELLNEHITITGGTGSITLGNLSNSPGPTRSMPITVLEQGTVMIKITKEGITTAEKTVTVFKKLGFQEDNTVTIDEVVKFGTPTEGPNITFARYDGDPIAVIPPVTKEPVTSITDTSPALDQVLATFDPPLDLTTKGSAEFRWFDMVWEGFGSAWTFDEESAGGANYTGRDYVLHNVQFQLDLITTNDERVRFRVINELSTTVAGLKRPVRFALSNIQGDTDGQTGNSPWGTGHQIKEIRLTVRGVQLRSPPNNAWPAVNAQRNANFDDMWIVSLTADIAEPPPPLVIYNSATGWMSGIENPRWGHDDTIANDATSLVDVNIPSADGRQNGIRWDPIDIRNPGGAQYTSLIVELVTEGSIVWFGFGTTHLTATGNEVKNQAFGGGTISGNTLIFPLGGDDGWNAERFTGFFVQFNAGITEITTFTEIRVE